MAGTPPPVLNQSAGAATVSGLSPAGTVSLTSQAPGAAPTRDQVKGLMGMAKSLARGMDALAEAMPNGAAKIAAAKDLMEQALADFIAEYGEAVSASPEETGEQFPSSANQAY